MVLDWFHRFKMQLRMRKKKSSLQPAPKGTFPFRERFFLADHTAGLKLKCVMRDPTPFMELLCVCLLPLIDPLDKSML